MSTYLLNKVPRRQIENIYTDRNISKNKLLFILLALSWNLKLCAARLGKRGQDGHLRFGLDNVVDRHLSLSEFTARKVPKGLSFHRINACTMGQGFGESMYEPYVPFIAIMFDKFTTPWGATK